MQSLLAYLLLHNDAPQSRTHLSYTFWPESSDSQARTNLRREFLQLRRAFPQVDAYLRIEPQTIQWHPETACSVDVDDFVAALVAAKATVDAQQRAGLLQLAATIYQGDLLPGLYDDWIISAREELSQQYVYALEQLTVLYTDHRNYAAAIDVAQLLLRQDPINETTYHRLMELYAYQHDRARALHTYHTCATVLERELGIAPGAEVQRLYEQLYHGETAAEAKPGREETGSTPHCARRGHQPLRL
jgi:DNA-binding SARP family transcriptional activator